MSIYKLALFILLICLGFMFLGFFEPVLKVIAAIAAFVAAFALVAEK